MRDRNLLEKIVVNTNGENIQLSLDLNIEDVLMLKFKNLSTGKESTKRFIMPDDDIAKYGYFIFLYKNLNNINDELALNYGCDVNCVTLEELSSSLIGDLLINKLN